MLWNGLPPLTIHNNPTTATASTPSPPPTIMFGKNVYPEGRVPPAQGHGLVVSDPRGARRCRRRENV